MTKPKDIKKTVNSESSKKQIQTSLKDHFANQSYRVDEIVSTVKKKQKLVEKIKDSGIKRFAVTR